MNEEKNPGNTGKLQETRDRNGKFVKGVSGNPLGKPMGAKNKFSPVAKIQEIWEANPDDFENFINDYLEDPKNRQHIVEMLDGKPRGSETIVPIQNNVYIGSPEQDALILEQEIKDVNEELTKGRLEIVEGKIRKIDL